VPDTRLSRLRESPWLRAGLSAVAVGLAVYGLASQWTQVHAALAQLAGYDVAGAALAVIAGLGCMLLAWRTLLADLGSPLPLPAAIRVMFVGQLGKYVPGAVWALAAQVELARDYESEQEQGRRHQHLERVEVHHHAEHLEHVPVGAAPPGAVAAGSDIHTV